MKKWKSIVENKNTTLSPCGALWKTIIQKFQAETTQIVFFLKKSLFGLTLVHSNKLISIR